MQKVGTKHVRSLLEIEMKYWSSGEHEIDFVTDDEAMIEVKAGSTNPREFAWYHKVFPKKRLCVVSESQYETDLIIGLTLENFLLSAPSDLYFDSDRTPWELP